MWCAGQTFIIKTDHFLVMIWTNVSNGKRNACLHRVDSEMTESSFKRQNDPLGYIETSVFIVCGTDKNTVCKGNKYMRKVR